MLRMLTVRYYTLTDQDPFAMTRPALEASRLLYKTSCSLVDPQLVSSGISTRSVFPCTSTSLCTNISGISTSLLVVASFASYSSSNLSFYHCDLGVLVCASHTL